MKAMFLNVRSTLKSPTGRASEQIYSSNAKVVVLECRGDEELAIAALLHGSAEDQGGKARLEDVRNRFGERVARIVEACSDSLADTGKGERKATGKNARKPNSSSKHSSRRQRAHKG